MNILNEITPIEAIDMDQLEEYLACWDNYLDHLDFVFSAK